MDFECCQSPVNIMKDLDCKMVKFYHSVLQREITRDAIYAEHIKRVKTAYHKETIGSRNSDISFSSPATRCAYVFLYCASFGSTTAYHFLQLLKSDAMLLQKIAFQDTFHVCCLGGPGTEIPAIAKILDEWMHGCCPMRRKPLLIKATVIDADSGWYITAENLVKSLPQLVDASLVRCELDFVEADLTEPLSRQARDAIEDADLVTMLKFLSRVNGSSQNGRCDQMLQEVISCIKEGGRLFFIDSSSCMHFDVFREAMATFPDMTETYGPLMHDLYKMSVYSIAESIKLNEEIFGWLFPCTFTINFVSAWQRRTLQNPPLRRTSTTEEASDETNMKALREQVLKHFRKCVKFCSPKSREMEELRQECDSEVSKMFNTKTKIKRIEI